MKKFRSANRAIRRGHLRVVLQEVPFGFTADGQVQMMKMPKIERRASNNNQLWLAY